MTKIAPGVHWVGVVNWDNRECGAYTTPRGTTYNSYLVEGEEHLALVDSVKYGFEEEHLYRIEKHVDPEEVDYLFCNQAEPDHAGALPEIVEATGATVVCREDCRDTIEEHHVDADIDYLVKEDGEHLDLGGRSLEVIDASMLHWPESTFTYLADEKVLFSNDAFAQHLACSERFSHDARWSMLEATRYYGAILQIYSSLVSSKIEELDEYEIDRIAPAHGTVWTSEPEAEEAGLSADDVMEAYRRWSCGEKEDKAVVVYDSMWGSTKEMAYSLAQGLMDGDTETRVYNLRKTDNTDVISELMESRLLLVGSPTINKDIYPSVGEFLTFLRGVQPGGEAFPFGSFGWGSRAQSRMKDLLEEADMDVKEGITSKYVPKEELLDTCREKGRELAEEG